jgi:P-type conjugative transfer ATPase TrbB
MTDLSNRLSALIQVADRHLRMLRTAMGPDIAEALIDPQVIEINVNPDGTLWLDRLGEPRACTGVLVSPASAERIIRLVAAYASLELAGSRTVSTELPTGERFEGNLPPIVAAPTFSIRKRAIEVFELERYVEDAILTAFQIDVLRRAVRERLNILIAGGTSTGKTTLANALLSEIADTDDRLILIEDTLELQCIARDHVSMRTKAGVATMTELVRSALRHRPDRIILGEVRGPEALDLLKAWGTGHPGGVATLHAGSAHGALSRLEQLIQEAVITVPRGLIAETIDLIVFIARRNGARRVEEIVRVTGLHANGYALEPITPTHGETP